MKTAKYQAFQRQVNRVFGQLEIRRECMKLIPSLIVLSAVTGMLCLFAAPVAAQENVGATIKPGSHPDIPDVHASGPYDWHPGYSIGQSERHQRILPAANTTLDLRTYCILPEECTRVDPPRDSPDCGIRPNEPPKYPCLKEIWIRRDKCCVAIVRVELSGKVSFNPKGFDYGPIPALCDITRTQADELWATDGGKSVNGNFVTYKLGSYQSKSDLFIDVVFHHDKVQKYRMRSKLLDSSQWYRVQ